MHLTKAQRADLKDSLLTTGVGSGVEVGLTVGDATGLGEGFPVGLGEGLEVGVAVSTSVGLDEGFDEGLGDGAGVGLDEGCVVANAVVVLAVVVLLDVVVRLDEGHHPTSFQSEVEDPGTLLFPLQRSPSH